MKEPYITRKLENTILRYLNTPEIIAIVGPRQSGKTTLLERVFEPLKKQAVFLTFEDKKTLDLFVHNIDEFIELYIKPYKYVFLDEFQYAKKGGKLLKYIIDTQKSKIFISGSSSIELTVQAVKYLTGRIFVFSLFPLDFEEYLRFKNPNLFTLYSKRKIALSDYGLKPFSAISENIVEQIQNHYQDYVIYGGYPRVALATNSDEKKTILQNIYNTYFLREVKDILGLVDDYKLTQMIKALALQIGSLIQYREISDVSELSFQTVKGYLNFLQKTFVAILVKPYFKNKRTEIVKNPKIYFFDTGLRNYIVDDFRKIGDRTDSGFLLENSVAMQLTKQEISFKFWRTKQKSEVDFVLDLGERKKLALEVKKSFRDGDFNSKSARDFKAQHLEVSLFFGSYEQKSEKPKPISLNVVFLPMI
ncbi:MAG: ATP-binding protein [bacterium]|nr:ATP-binding protein [bacterium]